MAAAGETGPRETELQWVLEAGLGPLLHRVVCEQGGQAFPAAWRHTLLRFDLTARFRHACLQAAARDAIEASGQAGVLPTLLKGISTSDDLYPEPHLRPMGDVDVLVPADAYSAVESELMQRGYVPYGGEPGHHGQALYNSERNAWIELHTVLFPPGSHVDVGNAFAALRLRAETVPGTFRGLPVGRLSPEVHLPYAASSLMVDLTIEGVQPSFLSTLIDTIYLLRSKGAAIDWQRLDSGLDNPMARASTFVTLSYLVRRELAHVPSGVLARLAEEQSIVGPIQTACIHAMLDRYFIAGRRWNLPFPPPVPGRYDFRFQVKKRIVDRLRRVVHDI